MKPITNLVLVAAVALSAAACTNPDVPQGFEGYVYRKPLMFGKMEFVKDLRGPATTGVSWRLYTINVDMRAKSYKEDFQLLTHDNLNVSFEVNTRIKLKDGSVQEIVEKWGGPDWYAWNVKEQLRTIVREEMTQFPATKVQLETPVVRAQVANKLTEKFKGTPVQIESVDIGQIQFPKEVADAIQHKIATKQELERQQYVLAKTKKEAAIRVLEALKVAKQQRIISSTLDPLYVQERAVQAYRKISASPNKTIIMLPNTPDGTGMPQVLTQGKRKVLTAADEKLLEDMEKRYMKVARSKPNGVDTPDDAKPAPDDAKPDDAKPDDAKADDAKPDAKPDDAKPAAPDAKKPASPPAP